MPRAQHGTQNERMRRMIKIVRHHLVSKIYRWIAVGALLPALVACNRPVGMSTVDQTALYEETFSPVYMEFDSKVWQPVAKPSGQAPKQTGSWNSKTKRGSRQISGVLQLPPPANLAQMLKQVDGYLSQRTTQFHLEEDLPQFLTGREATMPIRLIGKAYERTILL